MAASPKQIDANRRNAQKSTGPRTAEGKARISLNALRHGLAAAPNTLLPHEDAAEYEAMRAGLMESWQPANPQERQLVDAIADGWLRMQRALRFETALFSVTIHDLKRRRRVPKAPAAGDDTAIAVTLGDPDHELAHRQLQRYQKSAESSYYRAMDHLRKVRNDRLRREQPRARTAQPSRYVTIHPETDAPSKTQAAENKPRMGSFREPAEHRSAPVVSIRPDTAAAGNTAPKSSVENAGADVVKW